MAISVKRKIGEGIFAAVSSKLIVMLASFFSSVLIIRNLSLYEYGLLTLVLSIVIMVLSSTRLGLQPLIISEIAGEIEQNRLDRVKSLIIGFGVFEVGIRGFLFFLLFFSAPNSIASFIALILQEGDVSSGLIKLGSFLFIGETIKNVFFVVFSSHLNFKRNLFLEAVENLLRLNLIVIMVVFLKKGIGGVILAYILALFISIFISLPSFIRTVRYLKDVKQAESGVYNLMKAHGKWAAIYSVLRSSLPNVMIWIIASLLGVAAVGIFSVAQKGSGIIWSLIASIKEPLVPIISREISDWKKTETIMNRLTKYSFWISIPVVLISFFSATYIINFLLTGKNMAEVDTTIGIFKIILWVSLVYPARIGFTSLFFALKLQKYLVMSYIVDTVSLIILGSTLTYLFALKGAAFTLILKEFISASYEYRLIKKAKENFRIDYYSMINIDDFDKKLAKTIFREFKSRIKLV